MKDTRRYWLNALLSGPRFNGDRAKFCRDAGISNGRLSQLLDPKEPFGDVAVKNLIDKLTLNDGYFNQARPTGGNTTGESADQPPPVEIDLENNPDYPAVRRVSIKAQAGVSGYAVEYMGDDGHPIVFRRDWYTLHNYDPARMLALRVTGESMVPNLYAGDMIVINTAKTEPVDGIAFLVSYEGEVMVKRLVRDDGQWWLSSDNADQRRFPRKRCNGETQIIGEVVYRQTERI